VDVVLHVLHCSRVGVKIALLSLLAFVDFARVPSHYPDENSQDTDGLDAKVAAGLRRLSAYAIHTCYTGKNSRTQVQLLLGSIVSVCRFTP